MSAAAMETDGAPASGGTASIQAVVDESASTASHAAQEDGGNVTTRADLTSEELELTAVARARIAECVPPVLPCHAVNSQWRTMPNSPVT